MLQMLVVSGCHKKLADQAITSFHSAHLPVLFVEWEYNLSNLLLLDVVRFDQAEKP
jgi:hypothetical protein